MQWKYTCHRTSISDDKAETYLLIKDAMEDNSQPALQYMATKSIDIIYCGKSQIFDTSPQYGNVDRDPAMATTDSH